VQTHKLTFELLSPVITPFHADTIFGHYAWALRYIKGEKHLEEFLEQMQVFPLVLFSDGFPEGLFPRPVTPPFTDMQELLMWKIFTMNIPDSIAFNLALKKLKKVQYISLNTFAEMSDDYSEPALYSRVFGGELCSKDFASRGGECTEGDESCLDLPPYTTSACRKKTHFEKEIVAHNTINRISNTTGAGGGFYQVEETFYETGQRFNIYVKCSESVLPEVKDVFKVIEFGGFGKDKSTGKGRFSILSWETFDLPESTEPNTVMSLSSMIPARDDPTDARYQLMTKYGRLGGDFAKSAYPGGHALIPFKKPLIMMKAGAVFSWDNNAPKKDYLGCLMANVHHYAPIRHYAYGFPLYFTFAE